MIVVLSACAIPGFTTGGVASFATSAQPAPEPDAAVHASSPPPGPAPATSRHTRDPNPGDIGARGIVLAQAAASRANRDLGFIAENERDLEGSGAGNQGPRLIENASRCREAVEHALANGVAATAPLEVETFLSRSQTMTLGEVITRVCEPLAVKARSWGTDVQRAKDQARARIEAPYRAAGIAGDKLALVIESKVYGIGGGELSPAAANRATIVFALDGGGDRAWTLFRYVFSGNRRVSETREELWLRPGPSKFR